MQSGGSDLYDRLMAVKPEKLSPNAWAKLAGVSRMVFSDVKRRGNITHGTLTKLLGAVDVSLAQFEAGEAVVKSEVRGTGMSAQDVHAAWRGPEHVKPVPLLGSAFGGEWEEGIEMIELHLSEALDYLGRPPSLSTDPDAYAVEIIGDSMSPRFEPGERAFVSPRAPVRIGDDVIVQLKGNGEDQLADRVAMVLIKRLAKRGPAFLELRQFNPDRTFRIEMDRVAAVHRVKGRL
jgi:phage repressor protein C with HTH and peptisase S24 domain